MLAALGMTITGAAGQMATQGGYSGNDVDPGDAFSNQAGREMQSTGRRAFSQSLHRPPTGKGQSGTDFFVVVTTPLEFDGPFADEHFADRR
jgi:hypothetical protein